MKRPKVIRKKYTKKAWRKKEEKCIEALENARTKLNDGLPYQSCKMAAEAMSYFGLKAQEVILNPIRKRSGKNISALSAPLR